MEVYYLTLIVVAVCSFAAELFLIRKKHSKKLREQNRLPLGTKVCLFLTAFMLIFIAGSRYYVGSDFGAYYRGLNTYAPRLKEAVKTFDEPGLPLIATIVKWFTRDGAWFIMTCSALTIGLYMITLYRNEESYMMMSLLFLLTIWDGTFNGVRQYLASAVLFCGHRFVYEKKFFKWALIVFLAACIHKSALVMVVLFFLLRNKVNFRNILLLAIGTYIVSVNYDTIFSFLGFNDGTSATSYAGRSVNVLRILVACAPAILCLLVNIKTKMNEEQTFYTNAMVVHGATMIAASGSAYLARIGMYTSPFVVIALPKMLRMKNKNMEILLRVGTLLLYGVFWYIELRDAPEMNNYQFVWWH